MKYLHRLLAAAISAAFFFAPSALAQNAGTVTNHAFALGKGAGTTGYTSLLCGSAQLAVGQSAADPICKTITGDVTLTAAGVTALGNIPNATTAAGSIVFSNIAAPSSPASGKISVWADSSSKNFKMKNDLGTLAVMIVPDAGAANNFLTAVSVDGVLSRAQPTVSNLAGFGTGVATALGVNIGSAGAFVTFNGALGTPSSGTLTSATGLPISTGVSGLGTSVATFLATPSSANLRAALTDEVGTGAAYFVGGALGTPASATLTNATGLPLSGLNTQAAWSFVVNNTSGAAAPTAVDIGSFTAKASPAGTDLIVISDQAASGALKRATISSIASAGSVASFNAATGAITTANGAGITVGTVGTVNTISANNSMGANKYQVFAANTSGTVTTPTGAAWVRFTLQGGGAGAGSGGNTGGANGTAGNPTCINTTGAACTTPVYQAGGGGAGGAGSTTGLGGTGGTISGSGTCTDSGVGSPGSAGFPNSAGSLQSTGGKGGDSPRGGAGSNVFGGSTGQSAAANSGSGGQGGGGGTGNTSGGGGGAGAWCVAVIQSPAATYTYAVGNTAAGGTAGTTGGAGGVGAGGNLIAEYGFN